MEVYTLADGDLANPSAAALVTRPIKNDQGGGGETTTFGLCLYLYNPITASFNVFMEVESLCSSTTGYGLWVVYELR